MVSVERQIPVNKGMILVLFVCFFGAGFAAACDPCSRSERPFDVIPTLGAGDDPARPGVCSEVESEAACQGSPTCVWSGGHCKPRDFAANP